MTIKDVLEHQGGMTWVDGDHIPAPEELADLDALARRIAGQPHNFGGATTKAYHAITRGWVLNEVLRRVRPDGKSFGELVASEWCPKLEIDFYCGLPDDVKESRFNHVINSPGNVAQFAQLASLPPDLPMMKMLLPLAKLNDYDPTKGETFSHSAAFLRGQTPSASSVTNASSLAKLANCLTDSNRGNLDGYELLSPQVWERALQHEHLNKDSIDPCLGAAVPTAWGGFAWNRAGTLSMQHLVDFSKTPPEPYIPEFQKGEGWEWIGWGGAGGSIVQCAPKREVAMGFVPNWMLRGSCFR